MGAQKTRVGILFGGQSAEHEVSLQSAKNIIDAIDTSKYDVVLIAIEKDGTWRLAALGNFLLNAEDPKKITLNTTHRESVSLTPRSQGALGHPSEDYPAKQVDVIFPILHGPFGEDGTVQGLLKLAGVPFVGSSVLGSAVGMDKDVMKRLLRDAGIPIAKFITITEHEVVDVDAIIAKLGLPLFVKPANLGSSVGVSKVKRKDQFEKAITDAFLYDTKIIIEEHIEGREVECAVLGNDRPIASVVGEVIPHHEFYSYEAKYIDSEGATLKVPADISSEIQEKIRSLALKTFSTLSCEGLGRVDCFLKENGEVLVNEINTMPGFTKISMYPRLWEASGITYRELITKLIDLALERSKREQRIQSSQ